jgi:predicted ABC-type ATPase
MALNDDDLNEIYYEAIERPALATTQPRQKPVGVFLGGQPGAGKSTMARKALSLFKSGNFATVDVDQLRTLHPEYLPLVTNPETEVLAPSAVQTVCSGWADRLRESLVESRRNVLVDGTLRDVSQFRAAAAHMRKAGYTIEVHVLAVHEASSAVSVKQRFENEKRVLGFGRHIPPQYHSTAVSGVVDSVHAIEAERLADVIVVHNRANEIVYQNRLVNDRWEREPAGAETIRAFRASAYDLVEKTAIVSQWEEVLDKMAERGAPAPDVADIRVRLAKAQIAAQHTGPGEGEQFNGRITEVDRVVGVVTQKCGRDPEQVVRHATDMLSRIPEVGEVVTVGYAAGNGKVSDREITRSINR